MSSRANYWIDSPAIVAGLFVLGVRADGCDHLCAAPFRELHGIMTDRAGAAGHQHGLVLDRSIREQRTPCGHRPDAQGRAFGK